MQQRYWADTKPLRGLFCWRSLYEKERLGCPALTPTGDSMTATNKLTLAYLTNRIKNVQYSHPVPTMTLCILTMYSGYRVTGESFCLSMDYFDAKIGQAVAYENAVNKLWGLEGYAKASRDMTLPAEGVCQVGFVYRRNGELHQWAPQEVACTEDGRPTLEALASCLPGMGQCLAIDLEMAAADAAKAKG